MEIAYVSARGAAAVNHEEEDNYAYEERQEREALLKSMHMPMKVWYNSEPCHALRDKFGAFPLFWQELETWEHHKQVRKLYLMATDMKGSGEAVNIEELLGQLIARDQEASAVENKSSDELQATKGEVMDGDAGDGKETGKRKRRSRWGDLSATEDNGVVLGLIELMSGERKHVGEGEANGGEDGTDEKPKRKSRWSSVPAATPAVPVNPLLPAMPVPPAQLSQEAVQQTLVLQMKLKSVNERLMNVVTEAKIRELDANRSPSPPPIYDGQGKRLNTREFRLREFLVKERGEVIEQMMKLNPFFKPPADFVRSKPFRKLYVPYKEFPTYNFIGLIIGPRGNTQKRLESETGCKISIRGKGSIKDGAKGRGLKTVDDDDELHVHVQGETEDQVEKAAQVVKDLLTPKDDANNEHKQKQLRELALINGTLREEEYCAVCGEKGHRQYECPHRMRTFKAAGVKCAICGDSSHPTRDCPIKTQEPSNQAALDREYLSFMAELGDDTAKQHLETASSLGAGNPAGVANTAAAGPNVAYAAPVGMSVPVVGSTVGYPSALPQQVSYAPIPANSYPWQQPQPMAPPQPATMGMGGWPVGAYGYPSGYAQPPAYDQTSSYSQQPQVYDTSAYSQAYDPSGYQAAYSQTPYYQTPGSIPQPPQTYAPPAPAPPAFVPPPPPPQG